MASIVKDFHVNAPVEEVWDALRDFYAVHERLAPGFLTAMQREDDARVLTFANGSVAREVLVSVDDDRRRIVYTIPGERLAYHGASAQVFADGEGCRFVWITDLLPDAMAPYISAQMDEGVKAMTAKLESEGVR
jgi:carbon monoxide dehydrogenase subunit G